MHLSAIGIPRTREWPRLRLGGAAAFVGGTLLAAGAIHICAILLVPVFAQADGWSRLSPFAGDDRFSEIPIVDAGKIAGLDPLFINAVCRFDLTDDPEGITVEARDRFWSLALYDPTGAIVFSLNDRTALDGRLDMIVVDAAQSAKLKRAPSQEVEQTIIAESPSEELIAVLRLFAPTRSAQADARSVLARAECLPAPSVLPDSRSDG
jgi:uncharacterized membrane protein